MLVLIRVLAQTVQSALRRTSSPHTCLPLIPGEGEVGGCHVQCVPVLAYLLLGHERETLGDQPDRPSIARPNRRLEEPKDDAGA